MIQTILPALQIPVYKFSRQSVVSKSIRIIQTATFQKRSRTFIGISGAFQRCRKGSQKCILGFQGRYRRFQGISGEFQEFQGFPRCFRSVQEYFRGFQGVSSIPGRCRGFEEVSGAFQEVSKAFRGFSSVSGVSQGYHRVSGALPKCFRVFKGRSMKGCSGSFRGFQEGVLQNHYRLRWQQVKQDLGLGL